MRVSEQLKTLRWLDYYVHRAEARAILLLMSLNCALTGRIKQWGVSMHGGMV